MCNGCDCGNYDNCSVVGYKPFGMCCDKCASFDVEHTCLNFERLSLKPDISKVKILQGIQEAVGIKVRNYTRTDLKNFP